MMGLLSDPALRAVMGGGLLLVVVLGPWAWKTIKQVVGETPPSPQPSEWSAVPTSAAPPDAEAYIKMMTAALSNECPDFILECCANGMSVHEAIKFAYYERCKPVEDGNEQA